MEEHRKLTRHIGHIRHITRLFKFISIITALAWFLYLVTPPSQKADQGNVQIILAIVSFIAWIICGALSVKISELNDDADILWKKLTE